MFKIMPVPSSIEGEAFNHYQFVFYNVYDKNIISDIKNEIYNLVENNLSHIANIAINIIPNNDTELQFLNTISLMSKVNFNHLEEIFHPDIFKDIFEKYKDYEYKIYTFTFKNIQYKTFQNIIKYIPEDRMHIELCDENHEITIYAREQDFRKEIFNLTLHSSKVVVE